jgi:hypothetical protein
MHLRIYIIILCSLFFITSCTSKDNYLIQNIDFKNYKNIKIDASKLIVDKLYISTLSDPYIDHIVKQNLVSLLSEWATARLKPVQVNNEGVIKVIINNASIKALPINQNIKVENLFISNAAINIEMTLEVTIDILDNDGNKLSYVDIKVFKSQELGDNISLLEKDYQIQEMSRSLFKDFDNLAIKKIQEIFYKYL